jgi:cytidylate kinase
MKKKIIIAIDGYSSCGKSTLAKDLAKRLGYRYIDTGAMYRAVTLYLIENNIDIENREAVAEALEHIDITFDYHNRTGKQVTLLNGRHVEEEIRSAKVSELVSPVSTLKLVREFLVHQQKKMGLDRGIVMDGRDIGTVVFPNAEIKIFMTADEDVRVQRRFEELQNSGNSMSLDEVRENIRKRDYIDTHRQASPLTKAEDAIELDNTWLNLQEQEDLVFNMAEAVIQGIPKEQA